MVGMFASINGTKIDDLQRTVSTNADGYPQFPWLANRLDQPPSWE